MYSAVLEGLKPGRRYYYRFGNDVRFQSWQSALERGMCRSEASARSTTSEHLRRSVRRLPSRSSAWRTWDSTTSTTSTIRTATSPRWAPPRTSTWKRTSTWCFTWGTSPTRKATSRTGTSSSISSIRWSPRSLTWYLFVHLLELLESGLLLDSSGKPRTRLPRIGGSLWQPQLRRRVWSRLREKTADAGQGSRQALVLRELWTHPLPHVQRRARL